MREEARRADRFLTNGAKRPVTGHSPAATEMATTMLGLKPTSDAQHSRACGRGLDLAIFLFLLYSGRGWSGMQGRYLSGLAAGLCLVWNLGSLVVLAWPSLPPLVLDVVVAVSFSMLSILPAVLLQVSLEGVWPGLTATGYALSTTAVF